LDQPFRVQPVLDDEHRFFWTAGAEGELRFLRCQRCGYYLHPPIPRCPKCGSREVAPEAVSGRGEVFTYTVNHHSWDGSTEPHIIVIVQLAEQDDLRLTSNLYHCDPDDVRIGMPVQVIFEQHDQVWFPLLEPAEAT
jgi:uncharacterized OB-fold protein